MTDDGNEPRAPQTPDEDGLLSAVPGLVRVTAGAWWRTAGWTAESWGRAGLRLARAATSRGAAGELLSDVGDEARKVLGQPEVQARVKTVVPERMIAPLTALTVTEDELELRELRRLARALLKRSTDVTYEEHIHPAYPRIIHEIAPDEARILRLLFLRGPQPSIDVRASRALNIGTELVAAGLTMIGSEAGCRYVDRVPLYLGNLHRLGIVGFSSEPLKDHRRYQVLEAQEDVVAVAKGAGRTRTVRRSIELTPFGDDFCRTCFPPRLQAKVSPAPEDPA
jgi:hypothetical protein